jgi:hypothetical protein
MSKQDVYVAKMKLQLDELKLKMNEIESRASEASHDAKAKFVEEVLKLRAQSRLATDKLG